MTLVKGEADPKPKAQAKPDPEPVADASAKADPAIIGHHRAPLTHLSQHSFHPTFGHGHGHGHAHAPVGHGKLHKSHHHAHCGYEKAPLCSYNTTKPFCLSDYDYPDYEIKSALTHHKAAVLPLYVDVADLSTVNSVHGPKNLYDETYLCPSETGYVRPLRAVNTDGKWRIIVNNIKLDYEVFTQTTRVEECISYEKGCPLVPHCYESKCLQKSVYHRFLVYDPCDAYFPFAIETFKLPASCSCYVGGYYLSHK